MAKTRKSKSSRKATRKVGSTKRKLSGYMKFAKSERKKISSSMPFTEVGKELGKRWGLLSEKEKKHYN